MKFYNVNAVKKSANLSINSDLLEIAKNFHLNLSKEFESHLLKVIKKKIEKQWLEENQQAIKKYNQSIAKRGLFGDEWRRF